MAKRPGKTAIVALFDLDGVLIKPGGYRAAVEATINHFSEQMALGKQAPQEADIALMEARGVTSEWDMVPIFLTILLANLAGGKQDFFPQCTFEELIPWIAARSLEAKRDYRDPIQSVAQYLDARFSPAEALYGAIEKGRLMQSLQGKPFINDLLCTTRNVANSPTTRAFQTYILGDVAFKENYQVSPDFVSDSYLELNDRCLLDDEDQKFLRVLLAKKGLLASVITARPSLPPAWSNKENGYSPEAEMALRLTGLDGLALAGYGTMQYLGGLLGQSPDSLIKPSPVQALSAIALACKNDEIDSLRWAAKCVGLTAENGLHIQIPDHFELHIFEDSPIGIQASVSAVGLLNQAGYQVKVKAWGISQNQDKIEALRRVGATVFDDIHGAITAAFT
jgi:hypothetical protein